MGDYKSQYETYYSSLKNNSKASASKYYSQKNKENNSNGNGSNKYLRKLMYQSIGAGILLLSLVIMKNIPLEGAEEAYLISKETVDKNLGLTETVMAINIPELDDYKEKTLDWIDKVKTMIAGGKTTKENIKENYIIPVKGTYSEFEDNSNAVVIISPQESDVLASYSGKIVEVKESEGQKHITIDHGNGIETYYGLLSSSNVKKGDKVEKGQCIGRTGIVNSVNSQGIVYRILYMGIEKNPVDLIDFSNLKNV